MPYTFSRESCARQAAWMPEGLSPDRKNAMEFLRTHLPESDLSCYPASLFLKFADHALMLRQALPWCACLEEEIFYHYVLFPRVNDEDLSFHRKLFYDALLPRVKGKATVEEMVLEVNRWCHETASYQAADDRTASPLTVWKSGIGRCGEESAFLVCALRSVGIPARQVYAPRWAHCDDNHAWVEALCGGQWRFLGACEPEPVLDRGWFNTAASRAILVHSRLFGVGDSPLHGEFLEQEGIVSWYNQTARYAHVRTYTLQAVHNGAPAPGAIFQIQLLNEASFHTIATLTANEQGKCQITLGIGDFHLLAAWCGLTAEGDCRDDTLTLSLTPPSAESRWKELDIQAPEPSRSPLPAFSFEQQKARSRVLGTGNLLRSRRIAAFSPPKCGEILRKARGNQAEIAAFLERDSDPRREMLVCSLTEKDLLDVTGEILEDHLRHTPASGTLPPEIYEKNLLCPRIAWEPLTPWRGKLQEALPDGLTEPIAVWHWLRERVDTNPSRVYRNLYWTPAEALAAGRCNEKSFSVLYVALLRAMGIPARLRPMDGTPEYWQSGAFHPVLSQKTGALRLVYDPSLVYGQSWSLSRFRGSGWQKLQLPDGVTEVALPAGTYRLITTTRLPNGNQFAKMRDIALHPGKTESVSLSLRPCRLEDMLRRQSLPEIPAMTLAGEKISNIFINDGRPTLLCWLEIGREPTEHLLNELDAAMDPLVPLNVGFLPRRRENLTDPTLKRVLDRFPNVRILLDAWVYDLETVARALGCDPSTPPLAVVCDEKGQAVYGISGYNVGSGAMLIRISDHIRKNYN